MIWFCKRYFWLYLVGIVLFGATIWNSKSQVHTQGRHARFSLDFDRIFERENDTLTTNVMAGAMKILPESDYLKQPHFPFDSNFKNPCWWESGRLRCLPYYYVIGVKKSGTSDMFYRLMRHPDIVPYSRKEAQWFARGRFGADYDSIFKYVDMFNEASAMIEKNAVVLENGRLSNMVNVAGEGSPSNLHLNTHWMELPGNENLTEPKVVILDYIHHFIPQAKLIMVCRDPIDRLYSDYYHEYGTLKNSQAEDGPGPDEFHSVVTRGLELYYDCFKSRTVRSCVYEPSIYKILKIQMQLGIYYIYWQELTRLFPREQILIVQNADMRDPNTTMPRVFKFLGLRDLSDAEMQNVINKKEALQRLPSFRDKGPMFNTTRELLEKFYRPFNRKMAEITGDDRFLYSTG